MKLSKIEGLMLQNYFGKSVDEIIDWYCFIDKWSLFEFSLINSAEDLAAIISYDKAVTERPDDLDDNDALNFLVLMTVVEELALKRIMLFYYSEDLFAQTVKKTELQKYRFTYKQLNKFYTTFRALHWITPSELEEYQKVHLDYRNYYDYSLYLKLHEKFPNNKMYRQKLDLFDANFAYIFLEKNLKLLNKTKLIDPSYVDEKMFLQTVPFGAIKDQYSFLKLGDND